MGSRSKSLLKNVLKCAFVLSVVGAAFMGGESETHAASDKGSETQSLKQALTPVKGPYGYFIDHYKENVKANTTPDNNPAISIFNNTFLSYWSPDGTKKNAGLLQENLNKSIQITDHETQTEIDRSYLTDRQDLRYNLISGFGPYATAFIKDANAQTDFNSVPSSPLPANSPYSSMKWADENSKLGSVVKLVDLNEASDWSSTGTPKAYIKYVRPYRLSSQVKVNPYLTNVMASAAQNDYDFPSGHTTAAFETGESLAYVFPQRFQQLITRSSEVGYDRVLAGRHSPFAVMGGRILGTAMTASTLNDPANKQLIDQAYQDAQKDLSKASDSTVKDTFANYEQNLKDYTYRLTYGFKPISSTNKPMVVPKGAEVLLKTRFPYLSDTQRREILYTTGLPSGYPMLDDPEGWGRLNLFKAANGFGEFLTNTTVNLDASKGGFNANDTWKNAISGKGGLIKEGSGKLTVLGDNSYSGGTTVKAGSLVVDNNQALGKGAVKLDGGTVTLSSKNVTVSGNYTQGNNGVLQLNAGDKAHIDGTAHLNGKLVLDGKSNTHGTVLTFNKRVGEFDHVTLHGFGKGAHVVYSNKAVKVVQ